MKELSDVTQRTYRQALRLGLSPDRSFLKPVVRKLSYSRKVILRSAIQWLVDLNEIPPEQGKHLIDSILMPVRRPERDVIHLNENQIDDVTLAVQTMESPRREVFRLALELGLRSFEIFSLTREEVQYAADQGKLRFLRKGSKIKVLPVDKKRPIFRALLAVNDRWEKVLDIFNQSGNLESAKTRFRKWCDALGKQLGYRVHPHVFRRAFAQKLKKNGVDIVDIQEWLGHKSIQTTRLYLEAELSDSQLSD